MCIYELWVYEKCLRTVPSTAPRPSSPPNPTSEPWNIGGLNLNNTTTSPHQTLYLVLPCASSRSTTSGVCDPDTPHIRTIRRDRHCPGCFEALRSSLGGCGEMCWNSCGRGSYEERGEGEWEWDERLHFGSALVDLVAADGSDAASGVALDGGSGMGVRTDSRFRALGRRWSGWEDFR